MTMVTDILGEALWLYNEMAPYLLLGLASAGALHVFIGTEMVARHLGKRNLWSVVKAALFGVPLPLCSCGVIPAAAALRRDGASKGAVLAFLVSTPTTGVDSIMATYALLGPVFAAYRVIASFVAGVVAGAAATFLLTDEPPTSVATVKSCCAHHAQAEAVPPNLARRFGAGLRYGFDELLGEIAGWLVAGILVGGAITYAIPDWLIRDYVGQGWIAMLVMLGVGVPLYVCATGSIPIAAALMLKGMSPGAAFVFLLAGPATNTVTMTVVGKDLGKGALAVYLGAIVVCSLGFGYGLDLMASQLDLSAVHGHAHDEVVGPWVKLVSSLVLGALLLNVLRKRLPLPLQGKRAGV